MKNRLVLYYDKGMNPCKKEDAYFIKVYKKDGSMAIYSVERIE